MPSWSRKFQNLASSSSPVLFRAVTRESSASGSLSALAEAQGPPGERQRIFSLQKRGGLAPPGRFRERISSKPSIWDSVSTSFDETATRELKEKFFEAIERDNFSELNSLLLAEPDLIHAETALGQSALHIATVARNIPMIDLLVQKHADPNARDQNGNTPLHVAVAEADKNVVAALLILKADPRIKNNALNTPVHMAAREGKVEILQTLVDNTGTDINAPGQNGETALHVAAALNRVDCLDVLVRHRASICRPCYNGLRPIHLAASHGSVDVLRYLLTDGNVGYTKAELLSATDDEHGTPLHAAIYGGNLEAVGILIENGASIKAQMQDLSTPLHLACSLGVSAIVRIICNDSPSDLVEEVLAMKDDHGLTPLHRAVMFEHWKLIMLLTNKGANLDEIDSEGRTPLVLAASRSAREAVLELLMLGADTTIRDHEGRNFLHFVVLAGGDQETFHSDLNDDVVFARLLNEKDKHGCTPLHYAAQSGFGNCSEALLRLGASLTTKNTQSRSPLHFAAEYGRYDTVKKLLQTATGFGVINDSDREGCTPLHLAAGNGHTKVVQLLLTNGALIHKYIEGRTSLHAAVMNNHWETAELLVENYSYLVNIADRFGNTALHVAALHNAAPCVQFLLNKKAALIVNKEGHTAMDIAIMGKCEEVAFAMVHHDRWTEILLQRSAVYGWVTHGLIKELPSVMKAVLDRCVTLSTCHPLAPEYFEKYDYCVLQLDLCSNGSVLDAAREQKPVPLEALNNMVTFKRYDLLAHPVCKSYLNSKWMSYGIYLHFSNLLIYSAFLGMLTSLILRGVEIDLKPRMTELSLKNLFANKPNFSQHNISYFGPLRLQPDITPESLPSVDIAFLYVVMIFTACHLLKKLLQISIQGSRYFLRLTNYFELICYATALVFAVAFFDVYDDYIPWRVQWIFGAVAIFCAWFNLILHMQRYGKPGIYVGIFLREMRILMKAISVYFIMLIAFSMAFCVLNPEKIFPDTENFYQQDHTDDSPNDWQTAHTTLQSSIIRISDMLVGDVDAIQNYIEPMLNGQLVFPQATYFLALVTVGVITLLVQGILMGTAVYDLEKIEKSATINMLVMQVALHTDLESKLPEAFLKKVRKTETLVYPNHTQWRALTKWMDIFTTGNIEGITEKNSRRREARQNPTSTSKKDWIYVPAGFKKHSKLKEVKSKMDQQYELLRMIVQYMQIKVDTDVVDDPAVARRRISRYTVRQSSRPRTAWKTLQVANSLKSAMRQHTKSGGKSASFGFDESGSSSCSETVETDHVSEFEKNFPPNRRISRQIKSISRSSESTNQ